MFFSSWNFAIFFAIVCTLYWSVYKWRNAQNAVLFVASMYFYAQLHYSFPIYLILLITISYLFANVIEKTEDERKRKLWLIPALCIISAGLIYTKYSGFMLGSFAGVSKWQASALHILMPVGISFYTFAMLGYILEVYYEGIAAERNYLTYATYISFFPQLLSGPISSATTILPQFSKTRASILPAADRAVIKFLGLRFTKINLREDIGGYFTGLFKTFKLSSIDEGIGEFLWGLFKKMVVADNLSKVVSFCFSSNNAELNGISLYIGAILFGLQVYADFSGYSDMARGCAKFLGINLIRNFHSPMFSMSISEYWRRWHISLTTWFNAYIYNPIVFSLKGKGKLGIIISLFITFIISGIWHGAGWQYIIFGAVNGLALIYEILTKTWRQKVFGKMPRFLDILITRLLVLNFVIFSWIFFRTNGFKEAMEIIGRIFSKSFFEAPSPFVSKYIIWIVPMIAIEWIQRKGTYTMDVMQWLPTRVKHKGKTDKKKRNISRINVLIKIVLYLLLAASIYFFYKKQNVAEYYYFKF